MTVGAETAKGKALIERAKAADAAAERAFRRWFEGEVTSSSAAVRLRNAADEAWADVRLKVEDGDVIEAEEARGRS